MRPTCCPLPVLCLAAFLAVLASPRAGSAQTSDTIRGCVQQSSGQLRIIGAVEECRRSERLLVWNVQGPAGPQGPQGPAGADGKDGEDGQDGKDGKDGMTNIVTAEQTAPVFASRSGADLTWVPLPGVDATIVLDAAGTLDIHALGGVYGIGGGDAYCAFRIILDGVAQGTPGLYGDRLVGVGSVTNQPSSPYWTGWSLMRSTAAAAGPHTVSIEMAALDQTCQTDSRSFGSARLWILGR